MNRPPQSDRQDQGPLPGDHLDTAQTADRLHSAAIHLLRSLRVHDADSGLSAARLSALSVIVFAGPLSMGDLASAEQLRAPTVSRMVADLETEGLVERRPDPDDGRVRLVQATDRGRHILMEGRERRVRALAEELERLSRADQALLATAAELLERVALPDHHPVRATTKNDAQGMSGKVEPA